MSYIYPRKKWTDKQKSFMWIPQPQYREITIFQLTILGRLPAYRSLFWYTWSSIVVLMFIHPRTTFFLIRCIHSRTTYSSHIVYPIVVASRFEMYQPLCSPDCGFQWIRLSTGIFSYWNKSYQGRYSVFIIDANCHSCYISRSFYSYSSS